MMRLVRLAAGLLLAVCCVKAAKAQSTIHVPGDRPSIQAGIDAANDGDTVLVAPGTYYENIDFKGKAITVTSLGGAASTILDGGLGKIAAVRFVGRETSASILNGFTVQNGGTESNAGLGSNAMSGIYIVNGTPTISNNVITHNHCYGVYSDGSSPLIVNNEIDNTLDAKGGCTFAGGAAIWLYGSLGYYNGGNMLTPTVATVRGNTIQNNTQSGKEDAGGNGGVAVAVWGASALIEGNIIRNNATLGEGAIFAFNTDQVMVIGNLIHGNTAGTVTGGIDLRPPGETAGPFIGIVAGNTVYGNTAQANGSYDSKASQVFLEGNLGQYLVANNVIVGTTPSVAALGCGTAYNYLSYTPLVFDHNDIYNGGQTPVYGGACPDQTGVYGNISVDPGFDNPGSGDFHLHAGSPAIDAGNNSVPRMLTTDVAGAARIQDATGLGHPVVDMGTYETPGVLDAVPTILTLTPSTYYPFQNTIFGGPSGPFILTVKAASTLGTPTGVVTLFEDLNNIGMVTLDSTGSATFQPPIPSPGVHAFVATYPGQGVFQPAVSVKFYILFPKATPTIQLTSSLNPSVAGSSVTFRVKATSPDGSVIGPIVLSDASTSPATVLATLTPDAAGNASFTTASLALGLHTITAAFAGNASDVAASATLTQQVISGYLTTTTLVSSANPSNYAQSVTFTAHVSAAGAVGVPTGSVVFKDSQTVMGTVALDAAGNASFTTSTLTANNLGTGLQHTIVANYAPTGAFASSGTAITQVVNGRPSVTTLVVSPGSGTTSTVFTLTATVVSGTSASTVVPTGQVTFSSSVVNGVPGNVIGFATLVNGVATLTSKGLLAGTDYADAGYFGDEIYASSNSNVVVLTVLASPTVLTVSTSANPVAALSPVTFRAQLTAGGQGVGAGVPIVLTVGGTQVALVTDATGTVSYSTSSLLPGQYPVSAVFAGSATYLASSSAVLNELVTANATATTLTAAPNPAYQNQAVTLSFAVSGLAGVLRPADSVTVMDGGTAIGTVALTAAGTGTLTTITLAPGVHALVAVYSPGSTAFLPSQSGTVSLTILPQDFSLSATPPSISIQTEHHGSMTLTLASIGGFQGPVSLQCGGDQPQWLTCELPTGPIALGANATVPVTLKLDTDAVLGFKAATERGVNRIVLAGLLPLALLGLGTLRRRGAVRLLGVCVALALALGMSGCSGKYPGSVTPGTYTVNIVGTGQTAGSPVTQTHTVAIRLTVTP